MTQQFPTPEIEQYKGFEIRTTPNVDAFTSLIYKDNVCVGGTFATPRDSQTSIAKAKANIDSSKYSDKELDGFNHSALATDYDNAYKKYSSLAYTKNDFHPMHSPEYFTLSILSTSASELDESEEGELGYYQYDSKQDRDEDIDRLEQLLETFDEA